MATRTRRTAPEAPPCWAFPDDADRGRAWLFEVAGNVLLNCDSDDCRDDLRIRAARSTQLTAAEVEELIAQAAERVDSWRRYVRGDGA